MKLKLNDVKIRSFVTSISRGQQQTAKGGLSQGPACSNAISCDPIQTNDTCPDGGSGTQWPCNTVDVGCIGNSDANPCTGPGTWCTCPPNCS